MDNNNNNFIEISIKPAKTRSIVTSLVLIMVILVILNLVSSYVYYRFDVSKGKVHTLSKTSKNLTRNLKDNIVVKVYFSNNLPPEYNVLSRYAKDLLSEYRQFGGSRFRYKFINQTNEDEFRGQAARNNIFAQRVMILENDQQTVRDIFMGITFEYKGNRETLNLTKDIEGRLEYEVTALMRRLTKAALPRVTVFEDSLYIPEYYKYFEHHLTQNYQIIPTNLTAPVKASDVLIFPGVVDSLSQLQLFNLDQYIMHNGKVIILQDRVSGHIQYNQAEVINSNLFKLLEHYGIEIKPNLVLDQNCAPINMSQRSGIFVVDVPMLFPPIPMVHGIKSSPISKNLSDIILYLCSEINTTTDKKDITVTPLLKTSPNSGILTGTTYDISPNRFIQSKLMSGLIMPPITVAALYTGRFKSYYAGKSETADLEAFSAQTDSSEIIVVSDSDLIRDFIAGVSGSNMMFVLNAIDYLLKDISLSEVRSRTLPNSPLEISRWLYRNNVEPEQIVKIEPRIKQIVKYLNLLLPSLLLILYGIRRHLRLKRYRYSIMQRFELSKPVSAESEPAEQGELL
ncbi:MAG: Gldg family protein [Candidatus Cloacimonetes bacterium]|nr:Gldg family protein [Candidatus Cloacimonadota bacterium]